MESCSGSSASTLPMYISNQEVEMRKIEAAANKALGRIHSLYDDIMTPNKSLQCSVENDILEYSGNSRKKTEQNHCCLVFGELCSNCERIISRCKSCNKCECTTVNNLSKTFYDKQHLDYTQNNCNDNAKNNCVHSSAKLRMTVPQPFSISMKDVERQIAKECKISKLRDELNNRIENELKVRVCSKPVPKTTYLPLYNEMVKLNQKRRNERKEKCIQISKTTVKPFNLSAYNINNDSKSKTNLTITAAEYVFKAKPVPKNILSDKVSENLKNKEEIRKLLNAQRAEEILKQSALPFSKKNIHRSHSMLNLNDFNKDIVKKVKPKNLSVITDRLYTKKCKEVMEAWNTKVLEIDNLGVSCKKYSGQNVTSTDKSNFIPPVESLPFYFFPVRMSSAAMLRERQIRLDILARKQKIEQEKYVEEETAQKWKEIQRTMLPRLKDLDPTIHSQREIEERVKSFRASQVSRKQEYEKELKNMMKRVSKQLLLMERQSKAVKVNFCEESYGTDSNDDSESDKQSSSNSDRDNSEEDGSENVDSSLCV